MRNPVLRVFLAIGAVLAALLMTGVGSGVAVADPDPSGNASEPDGIEPPRPTSEPQPPTPVNIFDIPKTIAGQLNDIVRRPLSIFGNGRVPGEHTTPGTTVPDAPTPTTQRKHDKPVVENPAPAPEAEAPEPIRQPAPPPSPSPSSTVEVTLPFSAPVSIPVPSVPVPGYEEKRWSLNLTDPYTAYASVQDTVNTVNSLLADAYAPYNPFPPPRPEPTYRILQEEPVVEADGSSTPMSGSTSELPVLHAPLMIPPARVPAAPGTGPQPAAQTVPAGGSGPAGTQAGSAGVGSPAPRDSVTQPGSTPQSQLPGAASAGNASMGNSPLRQGYPQYLRAARPGQLAAVALPGLVGLIAITASGSMLGYRQANSGRYLRTEAARFLP